MVTPHIAGYSLEGKARGTQMIYEAFVTLSVLRPINSLNPSCLSVSSFSGAGFKMALQQHLSQIYDIARDDANLRACLKEGKVDQQAFDHLRKTYPLRREWAAHGGPKA